MCCCCFVQWLKLLLLGAALVLQGSKSSALLRIASNRVGPPCRQTCVLHQVPRQTHELHYIQEELPVCRSGAKRESALSAALTSLPEEKSESTIVETVDKKIESSRNDVEKESFLAPEVTRQRMRDVEATLSSIFGDSASKEYEERRSLARQKTAQVVRLNSDGTASSSNNDDMDTQATSVMNDSPVGSRSPSDQGCHEGTAAPVSSCSLVSNTTAVNDLVFGELGIESLVTILDAVGVQKGDEFLDIGSGHGMLVLAAALLYPHLQASRGVEIVPHLQEQALIYQQQLEEHHHQIKSGSDSSIGTVSSNLADIDLLLGNIYDPDPQLTSILKRTTIAVCFATTWSRDDPQRQLPILSHALRKGVLAPNARIVIIDGHLLPERDGFSYQGELRIQCPDTVPHSTAYLYTYAR